MNSPDMSPVPPPKPTGPFALNPARIVLLALGVLLVLYTISIVMGGLNNYQELKQGAAEQKGAAAAPVAPATK